MFAKAGSEALPSRNCWSLCGTHGGARLDQVPESNDPLRQSFWSYMTVTSKRITHPIHSLLLASPRFRHTYTFGKWHVWNMCGQWQSVVLQGPSSLCWQCAMSCFGWENLGTIHNSDTVQDLPDAKDNDSWNDLDNRYPKMAKLNVIAKLRVTWPRYAKTKDSDGLNAVEAASNIPWFETAAISVVVFICLESFRNNIYNIQKSKYHHYYPTHAFLIFFLCAGKRDGTRSVTPGLHGTPRCGENGSNLHRFGSSSSSRQMTSVSWSWNVLNNRNNRRFGWVWMGLEWFGWVWVLINTRAHFFEPAKGTRYSAIVSPDFNILNHYESTLQ